LEDTSISIFYSTKPMAKAELEKMAESTIGGGRVTLENDGSARSNGRRVCFEYKGGRGKMGESRQFTFSTNPRLIKSAA
jgi:hypothetical protein